ncbi:methyltransferase domain-containing protein [Thermopolyspora sp. NPDC052614]|uniref:methyltransferase domain-containing protein n=1 Tax=Thermopolyspora sp. NPDC052614 TaxID=3155682 RepID=UPI0034130B90
MTAARLVARCVSGLETDVIEEILAGGLGVVTRVGRRSVEFATDRLDAGVLGLRTADDVFLVAGRAPDVGHTRDGLGALGGLARAADLGRPAWSRPGGGIAGFSGVAGVSGVEVSASFLGRRNFNRYDAEDAVGAVLAERLGVPYHSRRGGAAPPEGCAGWRLVLDGAHATLMARVAARPLHRRDYKRRTVPGTLHPPVAAAMARLAAPRPGELVVDPCCGAGTLLIEARLTQPLARLQGYDLDPGALAAARANAGGDPRIALRRADAARLPLPDASVDVVLANPPWGGQVAPGGALAAAPERWWAELARVLCPEGRAVVLVPDTAGLAVAIRHGLLPSHLRHLAISGAHPHVVVLRTARARAKHPAGKK